MILADTSAWVEYDRATGSAADERLTQLIADGDSLVITEPLVMEVLAGAGTTRERPIFVACCFVTRSAPSMPHPTSMRPPGSTVAAGRPA